MNKNIRMRLKMNMSMAIFIIKDEYLNIMTLL